MTLVKTTETWRFDSPLAQPEIEWNKPHYLIERYSDRHGTIVWRGIDTKWFFEKQWYEVKNEETWIPCDEPIYEKLRSELTGQEAKELLKTYNRWRRGEEIDQPDVIEIGKAIDKLTL